MRPAAHRDFLARTLENPLFLHPDMTTAEERYRERLYDTYLTQREELERKAQSIDGRFDNAVTYLSAFLLTLILVLPWSEISGQNNPSNYPAIAGFWLAALLFGFFGIVLGKRATLRQIDLLDQKFGSLLYPDDPRFRNEDESNRWLIFCNLARSLSLVGLLGGFVFFMILKAGV